MYILIVNVRTTSNLEKNRYNVARMRLSIHILWVQKTQDFPEMFLNDFETCNPIFFKSLFMEKSKIARS